LSEALDDTDLRARVAVCGRRLTVVCLGARTSWRVAEVLKPLEDILHCPFFFLWMTPSQRCRYRQVSSSKREEHA
jgi:hypothetical protein